MCPKITAPTGRATKPAAKARNAETVDSTGSLPGKNNGAKTSAAVVPKRKKSYHSSAVPTYAAAVILRSCFGDGRAVSGAAVPGFVTLAPAGEKGAPERASGAGATLPHHVETLRKPMSFQPVHRELTYTNSVTRRSRGKSPNTYRDVRGLETRGCGAARFRRRPGQAFLPGAGIPAGH